MLNRLSATWQENLKTNIESGMRFYFNPRGKEYASISGTPTYSAAPTGHLTTGSFTLSAGTLKYLVNIEFPMVVQLRARVKSTTTGSALIFSNCDADTSQHLLIGSKNATGIKWYAELYESVTEEVVSSTSVLTTEWHDITFSINNSAALFPSDTLYPADDLYPMGSTATLYIDGTSVGSVSMSYIRTNKNCLTVDATNYEIDYIRIFSNYEAISNNVANNFKRYLGEEIFFNFNNRSIGEERLNISKYVASFSHERRPNAEASSISLGLYNIAGEFSADQYATFAPDLGSYNGTVDEIFLTHKIGINVEIWAQNSAVKESTEPWFEPIFKGSALAGSFGRSTDPGNVGTISISADDAMADIGRRIIRTPRKWENYALFAASGTSSLFHEIAQLATYHEVYNYLTNSGFENTTIGNSWTGSITRSTVRPFSGTYSGYISADGDITQGVDIELSSTERFTFSAYVWSSTAQTVVATLKEKTGATLVDYSDYTYTHSGKGWDIVSVIHEITDNTSNRLSCELTLKQGMFVDNAMLVYGDYKPIFVNNTNDGTSGICASSQAVALQYAFTGIDVDSVNITHPWATVSKDDKVHDHLRELCDASLARYMFITPDGVLRVRSNYVAYSNTALSTLSRINSLSMSQYGEVSNKLKVSGVYINKKDKEEVAWTLKASSVDEDSGHTGDSFQRTTAAGDYFPLDAEAPEGIECKYDEDDSVTISSSNHTMDG